MMTLLLLVFILLLLSFAARLVIPQRPHRTRRCPRPRSATSEPPPAPVHRVQTPKPPWVRREILRLKALMPEAGCRRIAHTFNRLHQNRRAMTVGKTFVAGVLRNRGEEVLRIRREIKHRTPRPLRRNVIWALDWTWMPGEGGDSRPVFGLLDHGSRACLELCPVENKRAFTLLRQLLELFERFGTPKVLRTDNEPAVRSLLFRVVLRLLGIRHERSEPFAPWQNGRIERLFRTVKEVIRQREAATRVTTVTATDLARIRAWYNHLRPHQHLDGRTPAEIWSGKQPNQRGLARWVSAWGGLLTGCYWPE